MNTRHSCATCFIKPKRFGQCLLAASLLSASIQAALADDIPLFTDTSDISSPVPVVLSNSDDNPHALQTDTLVCYAVADNSQNPGSKDTLVRFATEDATITDIGMAGTSNIEAVTFNIAGDILYAANGKRFGTLDITTGDFTPIGGFGSAEGDDGEVELDDIDGLAFDYATGVLYATHRREHTVLAEYDLLFQVNPNTGAFIPNAFGDGIDYVQLIPDDATKYDVDDIAADPKTGILYGVVNRGIGRESTLVTIDNLTGEITVVVNLFVMIDGEVEVLNDIEGLTFDQFGTLYGSTGRGRSLGDSGDATRNRLYQIDKTTGEATIIGKLTPDGEVQNPPQDFEALACLAERSSCVMYAMHDESRAHSQLLEIRPFENGGAGIIMPVGPLHKNVDIEGLAMLDGVLYGSSGTDGGRGGKPNGTVYEIDRIAGSLNDLGLTGYKEISSFTMNPADGSVWGWARGHTATDYIGPIKVDDPTTSGTSTAVAEGIFDQNSPEIEALAWRNDGQLLYATSYNTRNTAFGSRSYTTLWGYDPVTQDLSVVCKDIIKANVEALENQPNDLLMLGIDGSNEMGIVAVDPVACEIVASRTFTNVPYDDIEAIEWPAAECKNLSWLYADSGFSEIAFITYDAVPAEAEEALKLALEKIFAEFTVENDDGHLTVYVGDSATYKVYPEPIETRSGLRNGETTEIVAADLNLDTGIIDAVDSQGGTWSFFLEPVAADTDNLLAALQEIGEVTYNDGVITVTVDGIVIRGVLDMQVIEAEVVDGQPLLPTVASIAPIGDDNGDGADDYLFTYLDGTQQKLYGLK